jgi:murein DD-endopeptidase MepM/ murein hydrolase activator NlpD
VRFERAPKGIAACSAMLLVALFGLAGGCFRIPGDPDDPQVPECLENASFGAPEGSPYVLPYANGSAHTVFQTYCGPVSHGRDGQMSIDFLMPSGTRVSAARAGVVRQVVERYGEGGRSFNYVYIEHDDGTSAFYGHLLQDSVAVEVGDHVDTGQVFARSGSSGTSIEHLHFGVATSWPPRHPDNLPVNFRNAEGALDARGGLMRGVTYRAIAY